LLSYIVSVTLGWCNEVSGGTDVVVADDRRGGSSVVRVDVVLDRLDGLVAGFARYVASCDELYVSGGRRVCRACC